MNSTNSSIGIWSVSELSLNPPEPPVATVSPIATPGTEPSGQASGLEAGIAATGSFDPTHGWDLLDDQPPVSTAVDRPSSLTSPTPIAPSDQIHSLDDLFDELPPVAAPPVTPVTPAVALTPPTPPPIEEPDQLFVTDDDRYIPAAPDESLLPAPDRREAPYQEFWLDDLALSRLSEDLSSLESCRDAQPVDRSTALGEGEIIFTAARTDSIVGKPTVTPDPLPARTSLEAEPIQAPETATPAAAQFLGEPASPQSAPAPSAPPVVESDQSFAFSLDDPDSLDDLFETAALKSPTPSVPTVSAAPVSVSESFGFTLEGMDDLFADGPAPTTTPIPPPDSSPPTIDEPLGFTLEGMDDLFADLPAPKPDNLPPRSPENRA